MADFDSPPGIIPGDKNYLSSHLEEWAEWALRGSDGSWACPQLPNEGLSGLERFSRRYPVSWEVQSFIHALARATLHHYQTHWETPDLLNCELELLVTTQGDIEHPIFGIRCPRQHGSNPRATRAIAQHIFRDAYCAVDHAFPERIYLMMAKRVGPFQEEKYCSFDRMDVRLAENRANDRNDDNNDNRPRLFDLSESLVSSGLRWLPLSKFFWGCITNNWELDTAS